ncbi:PREDICTED: GBF-interacting protein 1-like isoform X1 [Nicotiana attenuata]|uniref:Gbf-interacting protein 1 n=1 Tax=Nicotiana attenuata TaxID=49451 RepID=A0A1J6J4Q4_NICAT|nr:PREDICTED: GBF-interacting protein 1-like isoform X1 [Nicotiana attenuata]XP_019247538.1 PREDICTED: GBF-interacting protein 1-like isoform X1 [Nicotiana attenuata]OIT02241.1 gbf-interacting protein 1 [Nicotiana attenuata]
MSTGGSMIPSNVGKTIHDIKEIAGGKHSDDDIYAMLKECNMDPNDTAQKLLYLDTFHEVKRKRDRKKAKASNQTSEGYRWMSGMQRRGARNGRERISANYITDDASGRRHIKKENGVNSLKDRSSTTSMPVAHKTNPHPSKVSAIEVSADDPSYSRVASFVNVNKLAISTLPPNLINHHPNLDPGPTPAPTPTFAPGTRFQSKTVISRPNELVTSTTLALVSGVYSSASDPVLVPALNTRNSGIGTIKREIGSEHTATESTVSPVNEGRLDACQSPPRNTHSVIGTVNCINTAAPSIEPVVATNRESQHSNRVKGHSEVLPSQAAAVAKGAHLPSLSKLNSAMEKAVPQLDMKLEKLNISSRCQPVIFPNHLQVPESFRSGLTFGSLDPHFDPSISCGKDSMPVETVPANDRTSMETGRTNCSYQDASSAAQGGDYPDNPLSHQHGSENIPPFEVSGASPVYDQSKPEVYAGSQLPLQTPLDYSLGFVPPALGPQLVRIEGPEQQGGNSQAPSMSCSNSSLAQPVGLGQSSVTVPPHLFPLVRQPFPPNYIPYNPYIPHLYMPQGAHQFLGPSGFPQQPSAANFYMSPSVTAAGVKLPLPSLYKPAAIAGNLNHFGVPTGYSSYGSSTVSYTATPAPVCSASNEDLTATELKEKNVYSMQKQNEDSHFRTSAPGRDLSMLQANYFYNFPQDQQVGFAPAHSANSSFPGINPSQTIAVPSNVQPLVQQPQTVTGSVESDLPTSGACQQPQANIHWNNKLLNRENI